MRYRCDLSKAMYYRTYTRTITLINNYKDALKNVKQYQKDIRGDERLMKKLSDVLHWYYFEDEKIFAPIKFIGYKNIHVDLYGEDALNGI